MAKTLAQDRLKTLEDRIGHSFGSHDRLILALTHSSAVKGRAMPDDYERQEFLGDRVLGLCVAQMLFDTFPDAKEGELSRRLNALVSGRTCSDIADEIGLHEFIRAGSDVKQITSKRMRSVRADVVESLIAAIYVDAGLDAAMRFVERFWNTRLHDDHGADRDAKTALQEWAHANGHATPTYEVLTQDGPDHDPTFKVRVVLDGEPSEEGSGRSKRAAEQEAAKAVLERENAWEGL